MEEYPKESKSQESIEFLPPEVLRSDEQPLPVPVKKVSLLFKHFHSCKDIYSNEFWYNEMEKAYELNNNDI